MKIGILTQPLHNNYGGLLQNYALQQTLIRAGHDVETIDWIWPIVKNHGIRILLSRIKTFVVKIITRGFENPVIQRYNPTFDEQAIIRRNTDYFIRTYIHSTAKVDGFDGFRQCADEGKYDCYIVGSDQCWRPCYNPLLPAMFLNFVQSKRVKRVAYAASFGTDQWEYSRKMEEVCQPLVHKFDLVTVREDSGVLLCNNHFGIEATHVLDPTLLLTKEDYIYLIEKEKEARSFGSLFYYVLDPTDEKTSFINYVAEEIGLKVFQVLPKYQEENRTEENVKNHIEDCVFPRVTAWIRAFLDAEMTIVDSFHGMVFSILFNKPFWVIGNVNRGMARFTSLLTMFGLEERLLYATHLDGVDFRKSIDWVRVNAILEQKRKESKQILFNSLK